VDYYWYDLVDLDDY